MSYQVKCDVKGCDSVASSSIGGLPNDWTSITWTEEVEQPSGTARELLPPASLGYGQTRLRHVCPKHPLPEFEHVEEG
jgi:hypothetical protein